MAFTIPISNLVNRYVALVNANEDWRDIKFWSTYDRRHLCMKEISSEHAVNIARQIVNEACEQEGLEPIPVKSPLAEINFRQAPVDEWVLFCKIITDEVAERIQAGNPLSGAYARIYADVLMRIDALVKKEYYMMEGIGLVKQIGETQSI